MRRFTGLAVVIAVVITLTAYAAETDYEDVIYLKGGSIIRGTIIEPVSGETYKIEIAGGSLLVVDADEVEKIIREEKKTLTGPEGPLDAYKGRRWFLSAEPVVGIYVGGEVEPLYGLEFAVGGNIVEIYSVGLGFGYERMETLNIIPAFAHNRINLHRSPRTVIYPYLDIGYGILIDDWGESYDGILFGAGIETRVGGSYGFSFGAGLRSQGFAWGWSLNLLMFRFGFSV